ncbi:DUF6517 family protein [Halorubrum amylolyticum]|uniref:DUF6517 family protein n=1 Tax=Halorubrum amylolyticum TaxID=2508724 RepID=UPI00100898AF|nr:DUF6517 family protein [Halorubrum amylolyticum]
MHRRELLAAVAVSASTAVAGCTGTENGSYEFDAEPAHVPPAAASEAGYEGKAPESFTLEQEFDVVGVNAQVSATTWAAGYESPDDGSVLFVASTPDASVAGQSVNPLVRADDTEMARRLLTQLNRRGIGGNNAEIGTGNAENRGTRTRAVLGENAEISVLETTVETEAESGAGNEGSGAAEDVPAYLYVGAVPHREDVIALVGMHPTAVDAAEPLLSMMERVEH